MRRAFTLIELLIVVAIIGILVSIAVVNANNARIRAGVARVVEEQRVLSQAITTYLSDHDAYPEPRPAGIHTFDLVGRLNVLTSPIAYLSAVPRDYFGHRMEGVGKQPFFEHDGSDGYVYGRADHALERGVYAFHHGEQYNMLASSGPDGLLRQIHYYPPNTESEGGDCPICDPLIALEAKVVIYDPSNGIVSDGDIYRWDSAHVHGQ